MAEAAQDPLAKPKDDGGAATAERFRYQWVITAIWSCGLLDENSDLESLYCEQHEDVIGRIKSGTFRAVQIKTRDQQRAPFKTFDDEIITAIAKFVALEKEYPGQFSQYVISTNHSFFRSGNSGSSLPYVLSCACEGSSTSGLQRLATKLSKRCDCDRAVVIRTLTKVHCDDGLPKLVDADRSLQHSLHIAHGVGDALTYLQIEAAANTLVSAVMRASSAAGEGALPIYLRTGGSTPSEDARVSAKRIDPVSVRALLQLHLAPAMDLIAQPEARTPGLPESTLAMKLTLGSLSAQAVDNARDLFYATVHRYKEWESKFGSQRALEMNGHLKGIVRNECSLAYESAHLTGDPFGPAMLRKLNNALAVRAVSQESLNSSREHLLGVAFLLTDECVVWWSISRGRA